MREYLRRPCAGRGKHKGCGKMFKPTGKSSYLCDKCLEEAKEIRTNQMKERKK